MVLSGLLLTWLESDLPLDVCGFVSLCDLSLSLIFLFILIDAFFFLLEFCVIYWSLTSAL